MRISRRPITENVGGGGSESPETNETNRRVLAAAAQDRLPAEAVTKSTDTRGPLPLFDTAHTSI